MFTIVAVRCTGCCTQLHKFSGNWGCAIILLVLLIKVAICKLTAAQYISSAKMRKLQPRIDALKERYGDDKQKMQQAMMELYKKEKINPVAGCLPMRHPDPGVLRLLLGAASRAWRCARRRSSAGSTTCPRAIRFSSCR